MSDCKSKIAEAFTRLWNYEKANKGGFKIKAYKDALDKLLLIPAITVLADLEPLKGKTKDGGGIYQKAKEILETGSCASLKKIMDEQEVWDAYGLFLEIHGIGPAQAHELATDGYRSIADLRDAIAKGTLTLNKTQMIGLQYYETIRARIPRAEMLLHEATLKAAVTGTSDIVGSFRRGAADSGDIDLLLRSDDPKQLDKVVGDLKKSGYIVEQLAHGKHKFMGICKLGKLPPRRLDILLTPPEEYGYALLYFTGSQKFNIRVRQHALVLGYSLNEHTLSIVDKKAKPVPPLLTEEAILAFLGIQFVEPSKRIEAITLVA